jgi:cellobiose-specific phosphotransferase system component IIC
VDEKLTTGGQAAPDGCPSSPTNTVTRYPVMEFMQSWAFMGGMGLLLVVLIGLFIFLRMKPPSE